MGTTSSFFGGGGGGTSVQDLPYYLLGTTQTWTPPCNGCVVVHVIGGGGSSSGKCGQGAGGYSRKIMSVTTSDSYCAIVGGSGSCSQFCNITGTTVNMVACGNSGCCGGCASGGDINRRGGFGGSASNGLGSAGGGAVNIFGWNTCGGTNSNSESTAGGGGGVGTSGGSGFGCDTQNLSGGGGGGSNPYGHVAEKCWYDCKRAVYGGSAAGKTPIDCCGMDIRCMFRFVDCWGPGGGYWSNSNVCGSFGNITLPGAGGGGAGGTTNAFMEQQNGGMFAGGGGASYYASAPGRGGYPGGGAGGGTACGRANGGPGAIYVEYLEVT